MYSIQSQTRDGTITHHYFESLGGVLASIGLLVANGHTVVDVLKNGVALPANEQTNVGTVLALATKRMAFGVRLQ